LARTLRILFLTSLFLGCSGRPTQTASVGFRNQTLHSDADLWAIWSLAQKSVANQINLNPVQQTVGNAPPDILPGDSRSLSVMPHQLTVAPQPDIASSVLAASGIHRPDPTGMIFCPQPCNVGYTTAYSHYDPAATIYASSWESSENSFRDILEYEFENQILFALGYDMTWR
jgi:hypothetical protein